MADVTLPVPSYTEKDPYSSEIINHPGVVLDAGDQTRVCERLSVYLYRSSTPPANPNAQPPGVQAIHTGKTPSAYDVEKRLCQVLAVDLEAADDWWMVVDYPVKGPGDKAVYYRLGKTQKGPVSGGLAAISVVADRPTKIAFEVKPAVDPARSIQVPALRMTGLAR